MARNLYHRGAGYHTITSADLPANLLTTDGAAQVVTGSIQFPSGTIKLKAAGGSLLSLSTVAVVDQTATFPTITGTVVIV